jgi:hypothetical protein
MANDKDEDIEDGYAELKLLYAMENQTFRQVFDDWKKEEAKLDKVNHKRYHQQLDSSKTLGPLFKKSDEFGIPYGTVLSSIAIRDYNVTTIPCIYVKTNHPLFALNKDKDNIKLGLTSYRTRYFTDEKMIFNKKKKEFYHGPNDKDPIKKDEVLEKDKYINLRIDLSQRNEDIEREFKSIIKYFKSIIDDLNLLKRETNSRRQDIKLYKKYLRVYKLVQEKGQKWTEIAKEIFPDDFKRENELSESDPDANPDSALVKVHHYYKEAKRLIAEGLP